MMELIPLDSSGNKSKGIVSKDLCFMQFTIAYLKGENVPILISKVVLKCNTGIRLIYGVKLRADKKDYLLKVVNTKLPITLKRGERVAVRPVNVYENPGEVIIEKI